MPADLQQLSLTLHVEGFKSFDVSGKKSPWFLLHIVELTGQEPGRYGFCTNGQISVLPDEARPMRRFISGRQ